MLSNCKQQNKKLSYNNIFIGENSMMRQPMI